LAPLKIRNYSQCVNPLRIAELNEF